MSGIFFYLWKKWGRTDFCSRPAAFSTVTVLPDDFRKKSEKKYTADVVAFFTKKLMVNTEYFWWHFWQKFSSASQFYVALLSLDDFDANLGTIANKLEESPLLTILCVGRKYLWYT